MAAATERPAVPRTAATVLLLRDTPDGLQTWMMRRVSGMSFAPGAAVFPGGRVEPGDEDDAVPWSGADPVQLAARMGTDAATARGILTGALRELFEETGVLLATPQPAVDLDRARVEVETGQLPMSRLLADNGAALDAGLLAPWARWITPEMEQRRYDTWFFVAALPEGSDARSVSSEAEHAGWALVTDVLRDYEAGTMHVLPPTATMLRDLAAAGSASAALASAPGRSLRPVRPVVLPLPNGSFDLLIDGRPYVFPVPPVLPAR